jgi:hypothetical protein
MDPHPDTPQSNRETLLTLMLAILFGGGFLFFLILISGGFFLYVLAAVASITVVGYLHYLLWGEALTHEVAGEREEEELKERLDGDGWPRFPTGVGRRPPREEPPAVTEDSPQLSGAGVAVQTLGALLGGGLVYLAGQAMFAPVAQGNAFMGGLVGALSALVGVILGAAVARPLALRLSRKTHNPP